MDGPKVVTYNDLKSKAPEDGGPLGLQQDKYNRFIAARDGRVDQEIITPMAMVLANPKTGSGSDAVNSFYSMFGEGHLAAKDILLQTGIRADNKRFFVVSWFDKHDTKELLKRARSFFWTVRHESPELLLPHGKGSGYMVDIEKYK